MLLYFIVKLVSTVQTLQTCNSTNYCRLFVEQIKHAFFDFLSFSTRCIFGFGYPPIYLQQSLSTERKLSQHCPEARFYSWLNSCLQFLFFRCFYTNCSRWNKPQVAFDSTIFKLFFFLPDLKQNRKNNQKINTRTSLVNGSTCQTSTIFCLYRYDLTFALLILTAIILCFNGFVWIF